MNKKGVSSDVLQANIELIRRSAYNDFYFFSKYVLGKDLMEEQPHREVCEVLTLGLGTAEYLHLDNDGNLKFKPVLSNEYAMSLRGNLKKLLMLPRGSFKSTIASICFPIWLLWHNQNLRIMIDTETFANAKLYLAAIKDEIDKNELLRSVCTNERGEYLLECDKRSTGAWKEEQIILKHRTKLGMKEPSIFCSGADNARTGLHPDIIIFDDLVSERTVKTDEQIQKTLSHYRFSLSLLEPHGLLLVIGTRYSFKDIYGKLLEDSEFDVLYRPARDDKTGALYFPTRLTAEFLDKQRKDQGSYIFNSQYMLRPINDENSVFTEETIKEYEGVVNFTRYFILFDPSAAFESTYDHPNPATFVVVGIDANERIFEVEYRRIFDPPNVVLNTLFELVQKYRYKLAEVGVEAVTGFKLYLYMIKDEMKRRNLYFRMRELKTFQVEKAVRIESQLQPLFANNRLFIHKDHTEVKQELLDFPNGEFDDIIDCLAYITQLLRPSGGITRKLYTEPKIIVSSKITNY